MLLFISFILIIRKRRIHFLFLVSARYTNKPGDNDKFNNFRIPKTNCTSGFPLYAINFSGCDIFLFFSFSGCELFPVNVNTYRRTGTRKYVSRKHNNCFSLFSSSCFLMQICNFEAEDIFVIGFKDGKNHI